MRKFVTVLLLLMYAAAAWADTDVTDVELEYKGNITEQDFNKKVANMATDDQSVKLANLPPEVNRAMQESLSKYKLSAGDCFLFFCYDLKLSSDIAVLLRITTINKNGSYNYMFYALQQRSPKQELQVTRVENNPGDSWDIGYEGNWPSGKIRAQWDSLFTKYKLVRLESSDPFIPSDGLAERISSLAYSHSNNNGIQSAAYTIYLIMGNRKFICFTKYYYNSSPYTWVYEIK